MSKLKTTNVIAKVVSLSPNRQQYKPYAFALEPVDLYVQLEVPEEELVKSPKEMTIITQDGLAMMVSLLCDSFDEMHEEHMKKLRQS